jgi:hypothetical protein
MFKLKGIILALSFTAIFGVGLAATDGTLGASSTGTTAVTISIADLIQISGLSDITITPTTLTSDASGNTTACIYTNGTNVPGGYQVTATSTNGTAGSSFDTADGGGNKLAYSAVWGDGSTNTALTDGVASVGHTGANTKYADCNGSNNATLTLTFAAAAMQATPAGTYNDTLTLEVDPT